MPILKKINAHPKWKIKEESTFKSGYRHKICFLNGSTHIGEWKRDLKEGKGASMSSKGYLYEGDFLNGVRHGHGVLSRLQPDGSFRLIYNGSWVDGKREGHGLQRGNDGTWYDGNWSNGQRSAEGRAWFVDGCFYQGNWKFNRIHGTGVFIYPNGNWFDGEFNNGYRHGKGKFFHSKSKQIQEGVWTCGSCVSSTMVDATDKREHLIPPNSLQNLDEYVNKQFDEALAKANSASSIPTNAALLPPAQCYCRMSPTR